MSVRGSHGQKSRSNQSTCSFKDSEYVYERLATAIFTSTFALAERFYIFDSCNSISKGAPHAVGLSVQLNLCLHWLEGVRNGSHFLAKTFLNYRRVFHI